MSLSVPSRPRFLDPDHDPMWGWDGTCAECGKETDEPILVGVEVFCPGCACEALDALDYSPGLYEWDGIECDPGEFDGPNPLPEEWWP